MEVCDWETIGFTDRSSGAEGSQGCAMEHVLLWNRRTRLVRGIRLHNKIRQSDFFRGHIARLNATNRIKAKDGSVFPHLRS